METHHSQIRPTRSRETKKHHEPVAAAGSLRHRRPERCNHSLGGEGSHLRAEIKPSHRRGHQEQHTCRHDKRTTEGTSHPERQQAQGLLGSARGGAQLPGAHTEQHAGADGHRGIRQRRQARQEEL
eukprot:4588304-Amphidinium_carterae.1